MLTWKVKRFNCNTQLITDYDVLKNMEADIKYFKKICPNKTAFSEALSREFRWRYWCKSEHELIISIDVDKVILSPWCGCRDSENASIKVVSSSEFDWFTFANYHIGRQVYASRAKIDIYDQLMWRWDELVDYCWYTRLPYERKHKKFES